MLISQFTRLATRLSFSLACEMGSMFLSFAPATATLQSWVLGLGKHAAEFLASGPLPPGDGEILVIECDGKAIPTATDEEMRKRRQPRQKQQRTCKCQRHRGRACRKSHGKKKKRKRGDQSKNGRSAVLVAMYTLARGEDGKLHGPINKKVYGTLSCRKEALKWAREQATRRGFGPDTDKTIQIVLDGEVCLEQRMRKLFPKAILTLDVRHAQERLWRVGRLIHKEGSQELEEWVEPLLRKLHEGKVQAVLKELGEVKFAGPGSKEKRKKQKEAVEYLRKREELMKYGEWREKDLVLASGVVEGAARYVVGERLDNSGMRWTVERAEALLLLRCIEVNGDWDKFFAFWQQQIQQQLKQGDPVRLGTQKPTQVPQLSADSQRTRRRRKAKAT